jgi:hypothetical protein
LPRTEIITESVSGFQVTFDEIIVGRALLNTGVMRFFFEEMAGKASYPQVVVFERELAALEPGYTFRNERLLVRAIGLPQIERWLADQAPIW